MQHGPDARRLFFGKGQSRLFHYIFNVRRRGVHVNLVVVTGDAHKVLYGTCEVRPVLLGHKVSVIVESRRESVQRYGRVEEATPVYHINCVERSALGALRYLLPCVLAYFFQTTVVSAQPPIVGNRELVNVH